MLFDIAFPESTDLYLHRARVPSAFLKPDDIRLSVDADRDDACLVDIEISNGIVLRVSPAAAEAPARSVDLKGRMVWPALVDMHTHLDKGHAIPRAEPDGTIAGGANGTAADRRWWTEEDIRRRMEFGLKCAHAHGVAAIRTHLDSNHELAERVWSVFHALRDSWSSRIRLQGVGLAPLDMFLRDEGVALADLVAKFGGVLGGVTDGIADDWGDTNQLDAALTRFYALARERNLDVDLHVDQTDDIRTFALPLIAEIAAKTEFPNRIVCGHCVNLSLQDEETIARTLSRCKDAGLSIVSLPTPMMYLMDRSPRRTPRWRGVTALKEIMAADIPVAIAGDNCRDAWFPYGDHDMVDTFQQAVRVFQLDHPIGSAAALVGPSPASMIGDAESGLIEEGASANLILFAARSFGELMSRPQADRIVLSHGRRIVESLPDYTELD